jgi:hypothetical protein
MNVSKSVHIEKIRRTIVEDVATPTYTITLNQRNAELLANLLGNINDDEFPGIINKHLTIYRTTKEPLSVKPTNVSEVVVLSDIYVELANLL